MFDVSNFRISDLVMCNKHIRDFADVTKSMEQVANQITRFLYDSFCGNKGNNFALVRLFLVLPFKEIPPSLQHFVRENFKNTAVDENTLCLTLISTSGEKYEWNYRGLSEGHQVIPLSDEDSVNQIPMVKGIFEQLKIKLDDIRESNDILLSDKWNDLGYFHVDKAPGSNVVPAQDNFVIPYSIQSVMGFGGLLPNKKMFISIIFSKVHIEKSFSGIFRSISLSMLYALIRSNQDIFIDISVLHQDKEKSKSVTYSTTTNVINSLLKTTEEIVLEMGNALYSSLEELNQAKKTLEEHSLEITKTSQIQNIISSIMKISFKNIEISECLELSMDILFSIPWFSARSVGCIFLFDAPTQTLKLAARRNFPHQLLSPCKTVQIGKCLCGLAAYTGEIVFADSVDERHTIRFDGMGEHGHYCVPIKSKNNEILGVLNVDLNPGHKKHILEEQLLTSFTETLAYVIEKINITQRLQFLANYDSLTNIPNRNLLYDRLEQNLNFMKRYGGSIALIYVDLDKFKSINDNYGHDVGDIVLKMVASRIKECIRDVDTVARIGGDEFVILISKVEDDNEIERISERIIASLLEEMIIKSDKHRVGASLGVSIAPKNGNTSSDIFKKADIAMYLAKTTGGNRFLFYTDEMGQSLSERYKLENDIRFALDNNEIVIHYQPKIDIRTNRTIGVEALIRWQHPGLGLISPDKFIPIAEETGIIIQIEEWVLRTACSQLQQWKEQGLSYDISMAVNISMVHFAYNKFMETMSQIIYESNINPSMIEFEITESTAMHNIEKVSMVLKNFSDRGVKFSIDDFGTGYSSLSYLKYLPFNSLKIDKSFIKNISFDSEDFIIVKTIIDMAHNLKLNVIAEGVETVEQLELLKTLDCEIAQGFLFSKPVTPNNLFLFLQNELKNP
ncbi:MAG: EAL domain-containing protein [Nitrospirae bacterium]|nr:EAL domain-containing protein [Nitrospirota bacterium]MBF0536074.1 EAL domain-containing protein [Nitrospirota bacterium]MBF0617965.1 EAL domain-containing protein [Nitrospirota bacterium]